MQTGAANSINLDQICEELWLLITLHLWVKTQGAPAEPFAYNTCSKETLFIGLLTLSLFLVSTKGQWGIAESQVLIKSFVSFHTTSLSCLTHSLASHQISVPLTDNHTFVFCQLGKFQSIYPSTTHLPCSDRFTVPELLIQSFHGQFE